jgi:hypothetical protein
VPTHNVGEGVFAAFFHVTAQQFRNVTHQKRKERRPKKAHNGTAP